jgi:folate-binding protein YgfZ
MLTPLQDAIQGQNTGAARPAEVVDYRGIATAARFSDRQQELAALRNSCGVYDLGFRARISVTGGDRVRWMNGMVTNNVRDLAVGRGIYAFLLNPQGRILADMYIYNRGESLLVETDRSQVEKIMATFDHFIIMDDVELVNLSESEAAIGVAGPTSRKLLNTVGIAVPEMEPLQVLTAQCTCDCDCVECTLIRDDAAEESYEIWLQPKDVYKTWQALIGAGATAVGSEALEMRRIAAGIPLYGVDIRERDLPQETEQVRALNFNKGCYVGQEIVERIRSRGNVHRKFAGFLVKGAAEIVAGAKIISAEKEVGEITSSAVLTTGTEEQTVLLGYIRREVGMPGRQVTIGISTATVIPLPYAEGVSRQAESAVLQQQS